jgi:hypothetical protein
MAVNGEPSLGEIGRRLVEITNNLERLNAQFISREVYDARHAALTQDLADLRAQHMHDIAEINTDRAWTRRFIYGLLGTMLVSLSFQVVIALLARV